MPQRFWAIRDAFVRVWLALQVELHGSYSVHRLAMLSKYQSSKSQHARVRSVLLTPIPCILVVVLLDIPHLSKPSDGLQYSHTFWARVSLTTALIAFLMVEQMRSFLSSLTVRRIESVLIALLVAVCSTAHGIGLAAWIGYPLPFATGITVLGFLIPYNLAVFVVYGKRLIASETLRKQFADYCRVVNAQWMLTLVYPAFNFGFQNLGSLNQTLFAMVLPLLKMMMKFWVSTMMSDLPDLKPEFVIFNVEVFHALFVACCMQSSTSPLTTAALMVTDMLHSWIAIHDVNTQLNELAFTLQSVTRRGSEEDLAPAVIDSAVHLLRDKLTLEAVMQKQAVGVTKQRASVFFRSLRSSAVAPTGIIPAEPLPPKPVDSGPRWKEIEQQVQAEKALADCTVHLLASETSALDELPKEQRVLYVRQVLALLHMTEFILLIEYVEVIIPIIYSIYLVAIYNLPNRVYYPQLRYMSAVQLSRVVQNECMYACLELISFFVLDWILRAKVKFRPARQLSFVLGHHWDMVQAKLILWLMFTVQSTLVHVGNDYTFKFQWLHNSTYFD